MSFIPASRTSLSRLTRGLSEMPDETEEQSRAQIAKALRDEEKYLVKRLAMVRTLLSDMPKPGRPAKQATLIPGEDQMYLGRSVGQPALDEGIQ